MIHIRVDEEVENSNRRFRCGIGPELPPGDKWVGASEYGLHGMVDCPGCGGAKRQLGTAISELSGRPGQPGYAKFVEIARSWGYD
jgi:hypothetical protein